MHLDTVQIFKFNQAAGHGPIHPMSSDGSESLALGLITEEANELLQAIWDSNNSGDYLIDNADEALFKEMLDTIWVILSYCMRRGWNVPEGFRRLGESNLSKFNTNGDGTLWAEYFPSGKVKKSLNYKPVDLSDLVATYPMDKYPS